MSVPALIHNLTDYSQLKDGDCLRVPLTDIDPLPGGNIRKDRDPIAFNDLRVAIRNARGVTQAVTVRINPDNPCRLQLIAGYGRHDGSKLEGFADIPVVFKVADDKAAMAMMISENLDRQELSVADEITAAQRFISYYDGDYELAAEHLNWPVKKLRGRLTLNQCTENVLDALRRKDISIGHAEILSAFTDKLQDGTLDKILAEKWTVEYLKERAGKANRWLKHAIFDIADCGGCPHNSDVQAELFENTVGKAKCNNLVCFKEKTNTALGEKKARLEDEYGVVLLAIEKPEYDRNTVSTEAVGENQFSTGCTGCTSNVVILRDGINRDAGEIVLNQCVDTDCFRKMSTAAKTVIIHEQETPALQKGNTKSSSGKKPPASSATQKTPAGVVENNNKLLRQLSAAHFSTNGHMQEAISVAAMIDQAGFANDKERYQTLIKKSLSRDFNKRVMELYQLKSDELKTLKEVCYAAYISEATVANITPLMITALANDARGMAVAVAGWKPTKELLEAYLKQGLLSIAKASGFDKQYNAIHGDAAFAKLSNDTKGKIINALVITEFDWSAFAPDDYIKCLVK